MNNTKKLTRKLTHNLTHKSIIIQLLQFSNILKIFHWNTRSYSLHISSDQFYSSLSNNIDKLVEILLGNQRLPIFSSSISIGSFSDNAFFLKLNSFKKLILSLKSFTNIDNICDDIINDIDHFLYFYSFKN